MYIWTGAVCRARITGGTAQEMDNKADIIFINGPIVTVDKENNVKEAAAVKGNKIVYAGIADGVKEYKGKSTRVVDLKGRTLVPGFIDSHIHFNMFGMKQGPILDIDYEKAPSIEEIKRLIKEDISRKKPGEWVCLWGYDQAKLKEQRHPTAADLDEVAPENPVRCTRCCGHLAVYNSYALKLGGIEDAGKFAPGEVVLENGKPTGLLKESANMFMNRKVVFTEEQIMEGLMAADKLMSSFGVTTVHDAGSEGAVAFRLMETGARSGLLKTRIRAMIFDLGGKETGKAFADAFLKTGMTSGMGNEKFTVGPVKIMLDGSSSGPSSATREPYSHDPGLKGILVWNQEEVDEMVQKIHDAGYQMTVHALGDMAVEIIVNAYEKALKRNPKKDCRHRIEHCGIVDEKLIDRIKELGIVPIPNPGFIELNGRDYNRYYGKRVNYMFPCKSYLDRGIIAAIGSDCPVIKPSPMYGIWGALARADGKNGEPVGEMQKIDIMDAIRMYTYNGAYASFEEDIKGSIEEGKLADLTVLSENILKAPLDRIRDIRADMTLIDGEVVFERR